MEGSASGCPSHHHHRAGALVHHCAALAKHSAVIFNGRRAHFGRHDVLHHRRRDRHDPHGQRIGTAMTKTKKLGVVCPELIRKFFRNSGVTSVIWGYTLSLCGFIRKLFAVFDFFSRF